MSNQPAAWRRPAEALGTFRFQFTWRAFRDRLYHSKTRAASADVVVWLISTHSKEVISPWTDCTAASRWSFLTETRSYELFFIYYGRQGCGDPWPTAFIPRGSGRLLNCFITELTQ